MRRLIRQHKGSRPFLITSRLDNDDTISPDYVQRVQRLFNCQEREVISFDRGYIWHRGRVYLHRDRCNPFVSLIEPTENFRSVWCCQHHRLPEVAPVRHVAGAPAWIQVVHEHNQRNRVRGFRRRTEEVCDNFALSPVVIPQKENQWRYAADKCVLDSLRAVREGAIRVLRPLARRYRDAPEVKILLSSHSQERDRNGKQRQGLPQIACPTPTR